MCFFKENFFCAFHDKLLSCLTLKRLLKYMSKTMKTYLKMCVVGLIGTTLQLLCYTVLRRYGWLPFFANLVAVSIAIINNFTLNHLFTFKDTHTTSLKTHHRFRRFVGFSIVTASLQSLLVYVLTLPIHGELIKENLVVFLVIVVASVVNFFGYKRIVWP